MKIMKNIIYSIAGMLLSLSITACTEDEEMLKAHGQALQVLVATEELTSADNSTTRVTDTGYSTSFTSGDRIGIFAITLQVGDFYYQDGSIVPGSEDFYQFFGNQCIGVVFKVGAGSQDRVSDYEGKISAIHGYVLALNQSNQKWGDASQKWTNTSWFEYQGYQYTKALRAGIAGGYSFPACSYCLNYTPAPTGVSSVPLFQQVADFVVSNLNILDTSLGKVAGSTPISNSDYISSSTDSNISNCLGRKRGNSGVYAYSRNSGRLVRATLTF